MPVTLVDRLPLPNLKVYSAGSVLLLSIAVYYALSVTSDPNWKVNATILRQEAGGLNGEVKMVQQTSETPPELMAPGSRNMSNQLVEVITFMMQEPLCMWTLINMAYCTLAMFGFFIQRLVFGRLRVSEAQRVKDKFWNYVFYKFIFVFGVLNVQYMDEVLLWCSWFTLVGFLHLLGQLCKDRFDYLSSSPSVSRDAHTRLLALLVGILGAAAVLFSAALTWGMPAGRDTFAFMAAECLLVGVSTLHVMARYTLRAHESDAAGPAAYYTHLAFDSVSLVMETCHVAHMVVYSNVVVSMASLVLLMQLRHLLHALLARLRRHRLYTALADHMSRNYPMASVEEVQKHEDKCAICWEPMREARKLPCKHLFHNSCLCRWVQQDASCPTCRRALHARPAPPGPPGPIGSLGPLGALGPPARPGARAAPPPPPGGGAHNHLFHFDGGVVERGRVYMGPGGVQLESLTRANVSSTHAIKCLYEYMRARIALAVVLFFIVCCAVYWLLWNLKVLPWTSTGSRYVSWLPSFSVEVTRVRDAPLDDMVEQVLAVFPQYGRAAVLADLAHSRSPDLTVHNILEGRLAPPPPAHAPPAPAPAAPVAPARSAAEDYNDNDDSAAATPGTSFSPSAAEREATLRRRKEALLATARRRYLARCPAPRTARPATLAPPAPPPARSPRS